MISDMNSFMVWRQAEMKIFYIFCGAAIWALFFSTNTSYAKSSKTWSNIGKGLAIYEGAKIVTGRQGNILDDVTGGMQPSQSGSQSSGGTYHDGYNAGYQSGYDAGYNAGFRRGTESAR
jgi:hypothetical protein